MYGLQTIQTLNRKNAEAAAIMAKHDTPSQIQPVPHQATLFAPVEKINEILEGAKG